MEMTAQLCSAVLVALRHIMVYFTEGILSKAMHPLRFYRIWIYTDCPLGKAWRAMAQGEAYKQTLLSQLGRVRDLIDNVDKEAAVSSQYRLRDLEKLCLNITRQLNELKVQQNTQNFRLDEATKKDLSARIGQSAAEFVINSLYSHLSSSPGSDGRARGKLVCLKGHGYALTERNL